MTTALAERTEAPASLIRLALEQNVSADHLKGLFELQERFERNQAEGEFANALTRFQSLMPAVHKGRNVDGKFNYAPFESLMAVAMPFLKECGIIVTFDTAPVGDKLQVICKVRVGIHAEPTTVVIPYAPGNKAVNAPQIVGQTIGYGKRYALCAALNIVTTDEEDGDPKGEVLAAIAAAKTEAELDVLGVEFKKVKDKFDSNEQAEIKQAALAARERVKIAGAAELVQAAIVTHNNGGRVPDDVKNDVKILIDQNAILGPSVVLSPADNGHAESVQGTPPAPDGPAAESPRERAEAIITAVNGAAPDGKVLHGAIQAALVATANNADPVILEARLLKAISDADTPDALAAAKAECGVNKTYLDAAAVARLSAAIRDRKAALEKKPTTQRA